MIKIQDKEKGIKAKLSPVIGFFMFLVLLLFPLFLLTMTISVVLQAGQIKAFILILTAVVLIFIPLSIVGRSKKKESLEGMFFELMGGFQARGISMEGTRQSKDGRITWKGSWRGNPIEMSCVNYDRTNSQAIEITLPCEKFLEVPLWINSEKGPSPSFQKNSHIVEEMNRFTRKRLGNWEFVEEIQLFLDAPNDLFICTKKKNGGYKHLFPQLDREGGIIYTRLDESVDSLFFRLSSEEDFKQLFRENVGQIIEYIDLLVKLRNYLVSAEMQDNI